MHGISAPESINLSHFDVALQHQGSPEPASPRREASLFNLPAIS